MRKLLLLLLLLPIISASPILQFQHNEIQPGETIFATVTTTGEFSEQLEASQIKFFEGRKSISMEHGITFYNSTHYIYIYPNYAGNFTIQIENILYKEAEELKALTITQNFTVQKTPIIINETTNQTATQILSIKPGFVFTTSTPKIKLTNRGDLQLNITYGKEEISLNTLDSTEIQYQPETTFSFLEIESYKTFQVPIIYIGQITSNQTTPESDNLKSSTELLFLEIYTNNKTTQEIELFNFGNNNITNIETVSDSEIIELDTLEDFQPRGVQNLTLTIKPETAGHFLGNINITFTENSQTQLLQIPYSIFILPEGVAEENFQVRNETCDDLRGQVCESGSICNGTAIFTKAVNPEYCCLATCVETESSSPSASSSLGWIIGIIIILALAGGGYYFYKKQKKIVPETTRQQFQKQEEQFNKRITGGLTKT